jgi:hypothetical protein
MDNEKQLIDRPKRDSMSLEEATISRMWEINEAQRLALISWMRNEGEETNEIQNGGIRSRTISRFAGTSQLDYGNGG